MIRRTVLSVLIPLVVASPAHAQRRPITGVDVAGVYLGATPAEVRAALLKAGYRITNTSSVQSFDQAVRREAARRLGRQTPWTKDEGTSNVVAAGPRQEWAQVQFDQTPDGSRARSVDLHVPQEVMTAEAFREQAVAKYGRPDKVRAQGGSMDWCSPEVVRVCGVAFVPRGPRDNAHPKLTAGGIGGHRLALRSGTLAEAALAVEREAAVERMVPRSEKAAF